MGLLGDLYSYIDTKKRQARGLLNDPLGEIAAGVRRFGDDWNDTLNLADNAYPMPGDRTVLNSPEQIAAFRRQLADKGANMGMAAAINTGTGELSSSLDDAKLFADRISSLGSKYVPKIEEASGGSVYVTVLQNSLNKDGSISKRIKPRPLGFKARFADHPSYWGSDVSSDPITQNTVDDAFGVFAKKHLGGPPVAYRDAYFVPQDGFGSVTSYTPKIVKSLSGKSETLLAVPDDASPFSWIR